MAKLSATYVSALIGSISAFNIQGLDFFLGDGGDLSNGVPDPSTINAWTFGLPQERVVKNQFLEMLVHFHPMKGIYSDQEIWDNVKNYGCWCWASKSENFEGEEVLAPMRGIGDPVDETDSLCQQLFYCYECAQIDHSFWVVSNILNVSPKRIPDELLLLLFSLFLHEHKRFVYIQTPTSMRLFVQPVPSYLHHRLVQVRGHLRRRSRHLRPFDL